MSKPKKSTKKKTSKKPAPPSSNVHPDDRRELVVDVDHIMKRVTGVLDRWAAIAPPNWGRETGRHAGQAYRCASEMLTLTLNSWGITFEVARSLVVHLLHRADGGILRELDAFAAREEAAADEVVRDLHRVHTVAAALEMDFDAAEKLVARVRSEREASPAIGAHVVEAR